MIIDTAFEVNGFPGFACGDDFGRVRQWLWARGAAFPYDNYQASA